MTTPHTDGDDAVADRDASIEELETELAVLREENQRLRAEHRRLLQSQYRRSALGFAAIAILATGAGVVFGAVQELLLTIAAIAAFAAVLTYYLTPERFVAASVGESVYQSVARTGQSLIADLGLHDAPVYLPTPDGVRVFVPQHRDYELPTLEDHTGVLVVPAEERARGIALWPTGGALVDAFESTATGQVPAAQLPAQLAEALVEQFELVDSATVDSQDPGRVTIAVAGSAYGDVDRFDHPVGSLLATGLATALETPIRLEQTASDDPRAESLITCRWEPPAPDEP